MNQVRRVLQFDMYPSPAGADASRVEGDRIKGAMIFGLKRANGDFYTPEALADQVQLLRGAAVPAFLGHNTKSEIEDMGSERLRDPQKLAGVWEPSSVSVDESGQIRGDLVVLQKEHWLLEVAEKMPSALKASVNTWVTGRQADGDIAKQGYKYIVERVHAMDSVDIVTRGGTTISLFQSEREAKEMYLSTARCGGCGSDLIKILKQETVEGEVVSGSACPLCGAVEAVHGLVENITQEITAARDLPLAPADQPWDGAAAEKRVRAWAGGPSKEAIDWSKYGKAFMYHDREMGADFGAYKLGFADVLDGELRAVWNGVRAVMAVLNGARGGVDISEDDRRAVYRVVSRYYRAFDKEPPALAARMAAEDETKKGVISMDLEQVKQELAQTKADLTAVKQQNADLTAELDKYKVAEAVAQKKAVVQAEIDAALTAGLPKEAVTEVFRQMLEAAPDAEIRKQILADRRSFIDAQAAKITDAGATRQKAAQQEKDKDLKPEHILQALRGDGAGVVCQATLDRMARREQKQ